MAVGIAELFTEIEIDRIIFFMIQLHSLSVCMIAVKIRRKAIEQIIFIDEIEDSGK